MSASLQQQKAAWQRRLFALEGEEATELALDIFRYQSRHNLTYSRYLQALGCDPERISNLCDIPCLPISLYRSHCIQTGRWTPQLVFQSSGTTDTRPSLHPIDETSFYEKVAVHIFEQCYGSLRGMLILALLPDYLARPNSSLIHMLRAFMWRSGHPSCGFFMDEWAELADRICASVEDDCPKQLWGLPLPLLSFAEAYPGLPLQEFDIIETGGTKRNHPQPKAELHQQLRARLGPRSFQSEYGMTELLSQAYAADAQRFMPPPWVRVMARHPEDPLTTLAKEETGPLNIVDLANMHSCAFVMTEDVGRVHSDGSFELLRRLPNATPRGCHLLYER